MRIARIVAAVLLALPLIVLGANDFVGLFELPPGDGLEGDRLLQLMRSGGLMSVVALSHVVIGVMLLVPRTRFAGALLQVPMSLGILAFHATMLPAGVGMAVILLVLNTIVLWHPTRVRQLVASPAA